MRVLFQSQVNLVFFCILLPPSTTPVTVSDPFALYAQATEFVYDNNNFKQMNSFFTDI